MFKATFNTEYGKIEVTRLSQVKPGASLAGVAYFFGLDYEHEIDANGRFADWFGACFQVSYETIHGVTTARLARKAYVEIGNANVLPA